MNKKLNILIVDDDIMMATTMKDIFNFKGYAAETANSGTEALKLLEISNFDFVLSDIKMPDMSGLELFRIINERWSHLPVVLMTAYSSDKIVSTGLREGALSVITKPFNIDIFFNFFSSLEKGNTIVIIEDDKAFCSMIACFLEKNGFKTRTFIEPEGVMEKIGENPGAFILDMKLNDMTGLDIFLDIKEKYPSVPVILITGYGEEMTAEINKALELGAVTCLHKPFEIKEMIETLRGVYDEKLKTVFSGFLEKNRLNKKNGKDKNIEKKR